jgi:hypothetical protein
VKALQLDNYATQSKSRVKANKNTGDKEFNAVLAKAKSVLAEKGSTS